MNKNKAFTLIELLVVISIIGILSTIIFASLSSAREKSKNASVRQSLQSIKNQAELKYLSSSNSSYLGLCEDDETQTMLTSMTETNGEETSCEVSPSGNAYAVSVGKAGTNSNNSYCIDSVGFTGETGIPIYAQEDSDSCMTTTEESCFTFSGGNITGYDEATCGLAVAIPSSIGGVDVTGISANSLSHKDLTSVIIPSSVTTIGSGALRYNDLTSITIPSSVTSISNQALSYNDLTSVTIPSSMTTINQGTFVRNNITSVIIPSSVTTIGSTAFALNDITSLIIPSSVTTIGSAALRYNDLTSITIPDSVTSIGDYAFSGTPITSASIKSGTSYQANSFPASCTEANGCITVRP